MGDVSVLNSGCMLDHDAEGDFTGPSNSDTAPQTVSMSVEITACVSAD